MWRTVDHEFGFLNELSDLSVFQWLTIGPGRENLPVRYPAEHRSQFHDSTVSSAIVLSQHKDRVVLFSLRGAMGTRTFLMACEKKERQMVRKKFDGAETNRSFSQVVCPPLCKYTIMMSNNTRIYNMSTFCH